MPGIFLTLFPIMGAAISLVALLVVIIRVKPFTSKPEAEAPGRESPEMVALRLEIASLANRIASLESGGHREAAVPIRSGMNLNKRTQVLRQHRLGQGPDTIAQTLEMSRGEVDLLLKIQKIVTR